MSEPVCGACRAAGMDIRAPPLLCGSCRYYESEVLLTLKILFALHLGKDGSELVKFVSVVWPRATHFLNQLQKHIFLFTVSGSETTAKLICHLLTVRDIYIYTSLYIYLTIYICSELWEPGLGFQI